MIISVNWLKKFVDIDVSVPELANIIGKRLVEIESVHPIGQKYGDVLIVKVVSCADVEGSDHLHVTKIDDGGVNTSVERDENGYVQVVCGAPNVREGMLAAWLPPQSVVPSTYTDPEPFVLGAKPLRGVMSFGMLASAKELALYDDHTGIIEVDVDAEPGASFADTYELNDYLLDIENKSLTHRPDAFGVIGFAREVAGILGKPFNTPSWLKDVGQVSGGSLGNLTAPNVKIDSEELSERFQLAVLSGVNEGAKSSVFMQTYLARTGVRPVNALVDVSNYLMLLTGQPSHAYDYDKLKNIAGDDFTVCVRLARAGESLQLLDGKNIQLDENDIVVAAGDSPVGLAGIMGGTSTSVDENTTTIALECATFNLYSMRNSQMRHGIFSEAVTRFTKGVPAALSGQVLHEAIKYLSDSSIGMSQAGPVVDNFPNPKAQVELNVTVTQINSLLGTSFSADYITQLLRNVEFEVDQQNDFMVITVPYWRKDISIPEDIAEEVGRLNGFDEIDAVLPTRPFMAVNVSEQDDLRRRIRQLLVRAGCNEVLTYSFVHGDTFKKAGQNPDSAYKIVNSISPDLQYYRQSLTPSLLAHVNSNVRSGYAQFGIFEWNKVHQKAFGLNSENVPVEATSLAFSLAGADKRNAENSYYQAKAVLEFLLSSIGVSVRYEAVGQEEAAIYAPFEPKRSALVVSEKTEEILGIVGEYKHSVKNGFKLPDVSAGFEILAEPLLKAFRLGNLTNYQTPSKYPSAERDICFKVQKSTLYADITSAARQYLNSTNLIYSVTPVDIYQEEASDFKNITIRVALTAYEKTMTNDEIARTVNGICETVLHVTKGEVI